jgi:hypothetical protein
LAPLGVAPLILTWQGKKKHKKHRKQSCESSAKLWMSWPEYDPWENLNVVRQDVDGFTICDLAI